MGISLWINLAEKMESRARRRWGFMMVLLSGQYGLK